MKASNDWTRVSAAFAIEGVDLLACRLGQCLGIAVGDQRDVEGALRHLGPGQVDQAGGLGANDHVVPHVGDDTDDLPRFTLERDALADRVALGPVTRRQGLVDHRHRHRAEIVRGGEGTAALERDAKGLEVTVR